GSSLPHPARPHLDPRRGRAPCSLLHRHPASRSRSGRCPELPSGGWEGGSGNAPDGSSGHRPQRFPVRTAFDYAGGENRVHPAGNLVHSGPAAQRGACHVGTSEGGVGREPLVHGGPEAQRCACQVGNSEPRPRFQHEPRGRGGRGANLLHPGGGLQVARSEEEGISTSISQRGRCVF
ncbi:hypothetical protein T484DRAFT_1879096, partial [Baffinella frigidus]